MLVLVVDDNDDHRFLTKRAIAQLPGMDVETARGGDDALARLLRASASLPDLVLLDLKMDGRDGIDVLRMLRDESRTRGLPVVVFSSSEHASDRSRALVAGASDYVTKPVASSEFQACVQATVRRFQDG